jgi:hypothetical protein
VQLERENSKVEVTPKNEEKKTSQIDDDGGARAQLKEIKERFQRESAEQDETDEEELKKPIKISRD